MDRIAACLQRSLDEKLRRRASLLRLLPTPTVVDCGRTLILCTNEHHGQRLQVICAKICGSPSRAKSLVKRGEITLNGCAVETSRRVNSGDVVCVQLVVAPSQPPRGRSTRGKTTTPKTPPLWVGNLPVPITDPQALTQELHQFLRTASISLVPYSIPISLSNMELAKQGGRYRGHAFVHALTVEDSTALCKLGKRAFSLIAPFYAYRDASLLHCL
jgi:hypothetical protein